VTGKKLGEMLWEKKKCLWCADSTKSNKKTDTIRSRTHRCTHHRKNK